MKRDAYVTALRVIDEHFSSFSWEGPEAPPKGSYIPAKPPDVKEAREAHRMLLLTVNKREIIRAFLKCFRVIEKDKPITRGDRDEFIKLAIKDLFGEKSSLTPEEFVLIVKI